MVDALLKDALGLALPATSVGKGVDRHRQAEIVTEIVPAPTDILIEERGLTEAADAESKRILAVADDEAAEVRRGADEYAAGVLEGLEADVTRTLHSIERGIAMLDERRAAALPAPAPVPVMADVDEGYGVADEAYEDEEEGASPAVRR